MSELIRARDLQKHFHRAGETLHILRGVSLTVSAGEFVAVVGPSGAGKSTLLHLLGALDRPTGGELSYGDRALWTLSDGELAEFRNRTIGFVFQFHHLLPEFTALENAMMPALISRRPPAEAAEAARALLVQVGLGGRVQHRPGELSGGEQQRVAVARALVSSPRVLLADEPTGNLDRKTGEEVFALLRLFNRERGVALVLVTHNEALSRQADRILRLEDGRLVEGAPGVEKG
ncbi:MAG: ABC transporter ATP-binding protein [candidate division NC10 bacterium]|nr:ABC transporter ATP-binding protein [candidate division NC10 bacterium]